MADGCTDITTQKRGPANCGNYRGISLLCTASKVYERILERRLRETIEPTLEESQAGFRKGRKYTRVDF